ERRGFFHASTRRKDLDYGRCNFPRRHEGGRRRPRRDRPDWLGYRHRQRVLLVHLGGGPQPLRPRRRVHADDAGLRVGRSHRAVRARHRAHHPVRLARVRDCRPRASGDPVARQVPGFWPNRAIARFGRKFPKGTSMPQIQQFDTFLSQVFWLVLAFAALFIFLRMVALPKVTEVLDARRRKIEGDLEKAAALKSEAEKALAQYQAAVAKGREEAQALLRKEGDA